MIGSSYIGIVDRNRHFDGGRGTIANPYRITKIRHLNNVRKYPTARYLQLNDLTFTDEFEIDGEYYNDGTFWRPVESFFSGNYNGQGFMIENLKTIHTANQQGSLFNVISSSGKLENLYLKNISVNMGATRRDSCGGVAAYLQTNARLEGVFVDGSANLGTWVGGMLGGDGNGQVHRCGVDMYITTTQVFGGLVGGYYAKVYNSYSRGTLTGSNHGGGITGTSSSAVAGNCYSTMLMNSAHRRGIISIYDGDVGDASTSYWDTQATNTTNAAAGAFARTTAQMTYPYSQVDASVYVDWDFDTIWAHDTEGTINDGYPYLRDVTPITATEFFDYEFDFNIQ